MTMPDITRCPLAYGEAMTYWWAVKEGLVYNVYNSTDSEVHSFPDQEKAVKWMSQRYLM